DGHQRDPARYARDDHARVRRGRDAPGRAPDRRRARSPGRRREAGDGAREGRTADGEVPGLRLIGRERAMRCPFCDHADTQVIETRESDDGDSTRRRRRCLNCDKRFTTYERVELALPAVVKKNGVRTEVDRRKMRASMALALRKRLV